MKRRSPSTIRSAVGVGRVIRKYHASSTTTEIRINWTWQWQWVDDHFGPMGWFSSADKKRLEKTKEFAAGHWRKLSREEVTQFRSYVARLAYEQS